MYTNFKKKKGSLFVEASIVLPIFFTAILSLILIIPLSLVEVNSMECFSKASQDYAKGMHLIQKGPIQDLAFEQKLKRNLEELEGPDREKLRLKKHFGGGQALLDPGYMDLSLMYEVNLKLPLSFSRGLSFQEHLVFRGFIGRFGTGEGFGFDEMEKSDNPNAVLVFPRAGERYHREGCRIIEMYPVEKILTPALKKHYSPCKLCNAKILPNGSKVYCFESTGKVYHRGICTTVDRYVVEMDREEAIEKGYTPCFYCGVSGAKTADYEY